MTQQSEVQNLPPEEPFQRQSVATGISVVAAVLLLVLSAMSLLEGAVAIAGDELYVAGADYIYAFDTTTWGWIHLILGVIGIACALGLMFGTTWGRYAAVFIAAVVIVANFLSLPYYPAWSLLVIALSVVVIWAVTTWQPNR
ncbi:DUF7144 family membrane protein [Nocardia niwae]|uniref:DUF7144 domain-containing protein n=1 Tax=Nocardia niwae TaxID=626084 RepID=A0ABV2XG80_9NOCA